MNKTQIKTLNKIVKRGGFKGATEQNNDLKDKNILIVGKDSCYSGIIDYSYFVKELKKAQDLLTADMLEEVAE